MKVLSTLILVSLFNGTPDINLIVPEKPVSYGRGVSCSVTLSNNDYKSVLYDWTVVERRITDEEPIGTDLQQWPDGTKAWFGSGIEDTVVTVTVTAAIIDNDNKLVIKHASREVIIGHFVPPTPTPTPTPPQPNPVPPNPTPPQPNPTPPQPNPTPPNPQPNPPTKPTSTLGAFVFDHIKVAQLPPNEAAIMAAIYRNIADEADKSNSKYTDKPSIITDVATQTRVALGNNLQKWVDGVLDPLRQEFNKLSVQIKTNGDFAKKLREAADGFAAASR